MSETMKDEEGRSIEVTHFAKIDSDNIVVEVIMADQEFINSLPDSELWIETSINTRQGKHYIYGTHKEDGGVPLRKNWACKGYSYDKERDAFIPPQVCPSWVLNEETCQWDAPIPYPDDPNNTYAWHEDELAWKPVGDDAPFNFRKVKEGEEI